MKFNKYILLPSLLCMTMATTLPLADAPTCIRSFVHENLKAIGINTEVAVKVGTKTHEVGWASKPGTIALPYREVNPENPYSLLNLLQKQQNGLQLTPEELEKINLCRSVAQHEGTHLKHHIKDGIARLAMFGTCTLPLVYCWFNSDPSESNTQAVMKIFGFAAGGVSALFANAVANGVYYRDLEQRCDDGIADDLDVLQAAANRYRESAELDQRDRESLAKGYDKRSGFRKKMDECFERLTATHPSNKQRAEKFEQRIAKLKAQQAHKSE